VRPTFLGQRRHLAHAEPGPARRFRHRDADPASLAHPAQQGRVEARLAEAQGSRPGRAAAQQALRRLAQHRDLPGLILGIGRDAAGHACPSGLRV
jgi:hypothetical protein